MNMNQLRRYNSTSMNNNFGAVRRYNRLEDTPNFVVRASYAESDASMVEMLSEPTAYSSGDEIMNVLERGAVHGAVTRPQRSDLPEHFLQLPESPPMSPGAPPRRRSPPRGGSPPPTQGHAAAQNTILQCALRVKEHLFFKRKNFSELRKLVACDGEIRHFLTFTKNSMDDKKDLLQRAARLCLAPSASAAEKTPLAKACQTGNTDLLKLTCSLPASELKSYVRATFGRGFTALHVACEFGHLEHVNFLLKYGADVSAKTTDGWIPMHTACEFGFKEILARLARLDMIRGKTNVRAVSEDGTTCMKLACLKGHLHIVKYLRTLSCMPDAEKKDRQGNTSLHCAAINGHLKIVKYLCIHGRRGDLMIKNKVGNTPVHIACLKRKSFPLVQWLYTAVGLKYFLENQNAQGKTPVHLFHFFSAAAKEWLKSKIMPSVTYKGEVIKIDRGGATATPLLLDGGSCSICLSKYEKGDIITVLPCGGNVLHTFHDECIGTWTTKQSTCPLCRSDIPCC